MFYIVKSTFDSETSDKIDEKIISCDTPTTSLGQHWAESNVLHDLDEIFSLTDVFPGGHQ